MVKAFNLTDALLSALAPRVLVAPVENVVKISNFLLNNYMQYSVRTNHIQTSTQENLCVCRSVDIYPVIRSL